MARPVSARSPPRPATRSAIPRQERGSGRPPGCRPARPSAPAWSWCAPSAPGPAGSRPRCPRPTGRDPGMATSTTSAARCSSSFHTALSPSAGPAAGTASGGTPTGGPRRRRTSHTASDEWPRPASSACTVAGVTRAGRRATAPGLRSRGCSAGIAAAIEDAAAVGVSRVVHHIAAAGIHGRAPHRRPRPGPGRSGQTRPPGRCRDGIEQHAPAVWQQLLRPAEPPGTAAARMMWQSGVRGFLPPATGQVVTA